MKSITLYITAIVFLIISINPLKAQVYQHTNERLILSFKAIDGKQISVCIDTNMKYMVYRQGTKDHITFEYPRDTTGSFSKFKWIHECTASFGGDKGKKYYKLAFTDGSKNYLIYQYAEAKYRMDINEKSVKTIKLFIENMISKKSVEIIAVLKSRKGSLRLLANISKLKEANEDF